RDDDEPPGPAWRRSPSRRSNSSRPEHRLAIAVEPLLRGHGGIRLHNQHLNDGVRFRCVGDNENPSTGEAEYVSLWPIGSGRAEPETHLHTACEPDVRQTQPHALLTRRPNERARRPRTGLLLQKRDIACCYEMHRREA